MIWRAHASTRSPSRAQPVQSRLIQAWLGGLVRRGRAGEHMHALQRRRPVRWVVAQALLCKRRNLLRALLRHPACAVR